MFKLSNIPFSDSKALNALVFDYIHKDEKLRSFYNHFPDKNGFSEIISSNKYDSLNREILFSAALKQSEGVKNTSELSAKNILLLKEKKTFTVTTGHQLCLFTGPLYFIYKLFSAINLAEELNKTFSQAKFVPVYWMASEDHDFEEVNNFNTYGKNVKWESAQTGAVGDFKTEELQTAFATFKEIIGNSTHSEFLFNLFEKSYFGHTNLKNATRYLANELFGKYGLVIIDGNDPLLKNQIKDILKKDIFENTANTKVNETISELDKLKYQHQVNPRAINCFFMENGLRGRIEKDGELYKVIGTDKVFSKQQLEHIIENETEKISPNVVLRPLYQQFILPNVAYVGGPGEIAYWLEYKSMFNAFNIQYPILVPRNFVTIVDKGTGTKIEKLKFENVDFFKEEINLIKLFQVRSNNVFELDNEQKKISELYAMISKKIELIDKTLVNSALAEEQKTIKSIEILIQKANKALKQRSETEINQIKQVKQKLFPNGIPQERFDNFSVYFSNWGQSFFDVLKNDLKPLSFEHNLLSEG